VVAELDASEDPVLLVGHSMGGVVITAAAEQRPHKIERLVYLAAFLPRNRESLTELEERNPNPTAPPNMVPSADQKTATLKDGSVVELFFHDCSPADQAYAKSRLCPQALEPLTRKVRISEANYGRIPRAYIACTEDKAISLGLQRDMIDASPCDKVISLPASHSPFFSMPKDLAAALAALAEG
jgi:pimeloyl-ACP methyl ester carboxylesterase